jgi:glycosyltransferase involved in cell wall biosynthesis
MKPRLFLLPIEPLAERYTGAWYRWLPESFSRSFNVTVVAGEALTERVEKGAFLDLNSTLHYKAMQLAAVAQLFQHGDVKDGDSFFVADLEFWGIDSLRYLSRLQGIPVYIFGFMHAGSYTHGDFMEPMVDVGRHSEVAWMAACDRVFVGSEYHRRALIGRRLGSETAISQRIVVTGNPWRSAEAVGLAPKSDLYSRQRDIDVLFPHRPDKEKDPARFIRLIREFKTKHWSKPLNVAFTTGRAEYRSTNDQVTAAAIRAGAGKEWGLWMNLKREGFYALLRRSKVVVSTAIEENFGYAMVEAMAQGAYPLMPLDFSYPELVREEDTLLYKSDLDFHALLRRLLEGRGGVTRGAVERMAQRFDGAEDRIIEEMLRVVNAP